MRILSVYFDDQGISAVVGEVEVKSEKISRIKILKASSDLTEISLFTENYTSEKRVSCEWINTNVKMPKQLNNIVHEFTKRPRLTPLECRLVLSNCGVDLRFASFPGSSILREMASVALSSPPTVAVFGLAQLIEYTQELNPRPFNPVSSKPLRASDINRIRSRKRLSSRQPSRHWY